MRGDTALHALTAAVSVFAVGSNGLCLIRGNCVLNFWGPRELLDHLGLGTHHNNCMLRLATMQWRFCTKLRLPE